MAKEQNPYLPPVLATPDEGWSGPTVEAFKNYLFWNQIVSTSMIAIGAGLLVFSLVVVAAELSGAPRMVFYSFSANARLEASHLLMLGLSVATVGIFQRKHDPLAMLYSAFFGLLLLGAFAAVFL